MTKLFNTKMAKYFATPKCLSFVTYAKNTTKGYSKAYVVCNDFNHSR